MTARKIVILIIAALVIVFTVQNASAVDVHFLFWKTSISRVLMIAFLFGGGLLVGWLLRARQGRKASDEESGAGDA